MPDRDSGQGLLEIGPQVMDLFDSHTHSDESGINKGVTGVLLATFKGGLHSPKTCCRDQEANFAAHIVGFGRSTVHDETDHRPNMANPGNRHMLCQEFG
jgi:hypothetical protein